MIKELHIQNLAVIQDSTLDLDSPYLALVGETGAGKSLIVDSLSLLRGDKAEKALIRDGEKEATVAALFTLSDAERKSLSLPEDVVDDEGSLVLKRTISLAGSGRCHVNGVPCSLKELKDIGSRLVDIHSQGENDAILDDRMSLFYVDSYGEKEIAALKNAYRDEYRLLLRKKDEYADFLREGKELDEDYLRFQIAEIEKYGLKEDEIESLEREAKDLQETAQLEESFARVGETSRLQEGDISDVVSALLSALRPLTKGPLSEEAGKAIDSGRSFLSAIALLKENYRLLDLDPARLDSINERLFSLKGLQRKYGKTTAQILDRLNDYKAKLNCVIDFQGEKERREDEIAKAKKQCLLLAESLSQARKTAAASLSAAIGKEMGDLGLLRDGFEVRFTSTELGPEGIDKAVFFIRLNKGLEAAELKKAASGGEGSRLMLALKSVLNHLSPRDVIVLDEIDAGVSGKAASLMAKKIRTLSKDSQVLVVSHLAQVVASSKDAIQVTKKIKDGKTVVEAKRLDEEGRIDEIARMISGKELTPAAKEQARELQKEYR